MKLTDIKSLNEGMTLPEIDALIQQCRTIITSDSVANHPDDKFLVNRHAKSISMTEGEIKIKPEIVTLPFKFDAVNDFSVGDDIYEADPKIKLSSLKNGPNIVMGTFKICSSNIRSLEGSPTLTKNYSVSNARIKDLKGITQIINGKLTIRGCQKLTSLKGLGLVSTLSITDCNALKSLHDIHKHIGKVRIMNFGVGMNNIESSVLGLLLIEGLESIWYNDFNGNLALLKDVPFNHALHIIEKHLGKGRAGLFDCQEELIDAGLEEFAKL